MKALVFYRAKDCRIEERPMPVITQPRQVIVKVKAAGICGSDMATYLGASTRTFPLIPGHEFAGEVYAIGSGVTKVAVGERVVVEPITYCGTCYACRHGRPNICRTVNNAGSHRDGGMQEFFLTTEDKLFKMPDTMTYRQGALVEPFTIGAQINMRAKITKGDVVLIHGAGPIGFTVMKLAKEKGALCVMSEPSETRRQMARQHGADYTWNPMTEDIVANMAELTQGRGPNVVIDAAGLLSAPEQAIEMLAPGGRFCNLCFREVELSVNVPLMIEKQITIVGSRLETYQFQKVINCYAEVIRESESMITDVFPLEKGADAFDLFGNKSEKTCKILIEM